MKEYLLKFTSLCVAAVLGVCALASCGATEDTSQGEEQPAVEEKAE